MATYTMDEYQKRLTQMAKSFHKIQHRTPIDAARYLVTTAKSMAPKKSGDLRDGIRWRALENGKAEAWSGVPGSFKYQFWVNQSAPYKSLRMPWNGRLPTVYGDGSHVITGRPKYWHFATRRTRNYFHDLVKKNTRKALKATIG